MDFPNFVSFVNYDIAGQEQSGVDFFLQCFVCEGWIAGAQNYVATKIYT
jgi:hypothetical protein